MGLRVLQRRMHAQSKNQPKERKGGPLPVSPGGVGSGSSPSPDNGNGKGEEEGDEEEEGILAALRTAVHLFAHAVNTTTSSTGTGTGGSPPPAPPILRPIPHPGALYSLGVLWKVYPRLMARVVGGDGGSVGGSGVSEGYRHLCLVRGVGGCDASVCDAYV